MSTKFSSTTDPAKQASYKKNYPGNPVTETLTNGFFTVDKRWTVKYWNKSAEKILGVESKDIIGKNLWEKFAGIIPLEFYAVDQNSFIKDIPVHFEEYWGEMGAWFDVITYHSKDSLSVSFKSSNHPHAEYPESPLQRLKTLTELYRFVTEITNDCLWEWNLITNEIFWIDGGHKRAFGYQVENALIPQSFWESRIHPEDKERVLTKLKKLLKAGSSELWEEEYRFQKANDQYAYVYDRGHVIYDEEKNASRMIGATQDITEKVILENKLNAERSQKQRQITEAVITAQENERADIGNELNDNLNQVLAITKIYIQMARKYDAKQESYLAKATESIALVMDEIKRISKTLVTPGLVIGLVESIKNFLEDLVLVHPIQIEFYGIDFDETGLDEKFQLNLFRIVQEQFNNILKHAYASRATVSLTRQNNEIHLQVSDNGKGYNIENISKGVGITNIKSRVEMFHGTTEIITKPGKGYEMSLVLYNPGSL